MGRRALACSVDIDIQTVSSSGTCLANRDSVFLRICLFGRAGRTSAVRPDFPLRFYESFHFEKIFHSAFEPAQLTRSLENCQMSVKLFQATTPCGRRQRDTELAAFHSSVMSFLYPLPSENTYSGSNVERPRMIVLRRSCNFPGVSPQLMFQTCTVIREVTVRSAGRDASMCEKVGINKKTARTTVRQPRASRVVRFTHPPWDNSQPDQCHPRQAEYAPCGCTQRRAAAALKPCRKQTRRQPSRSARRCSPCHTVPCNSPCSDVAEDFCSYPCECPSMTELSHGFMRRPSRRAASCPPTRRSRTRCASPVDFDCSRYLQQKSNYDCEEPRPPFVVRKVDSNMLRRTPGLGGENRQTMCKKRRTRAISFQSNDVSKKYKHTRRAPRYVERCTVCDTYEKYMGKPYWGHQNGCHPIGLKQVPVKVTRSDRHRQSSPCSDDYADEFGGSLSRQFDRTDRSSRQFDSTDQYIRSSADYNASRYSTDAPAAASQSYDDLTERIEQALRISASGLSTGGYNTSQPMLEKDDDYRHSRDVRSNMSSYYRGSQ